MKGEQFGAGPEQPQENPPGPARSPPSSRLLQILQMQQQHEQQPGPQQGPPDDLAAQSEFAKVRHVGVGRRVWGGKRQRGGGVPKAEQPAM